MLLHYLAKLKTREIVSFHVNFSCWVPNRHTSHRNYHLITVRLLRCGGNYSISWLLPFSVKRVPNIMKIRQCFLELQLKMLGMFFETPCIHCVLGRQVQVIVIGVIHIANQYTIQLHDDWRFSQHEIREQPIVSNSVVESRWLCYFQESRSTYQKFYFLESRISVKIFYFLESRK